MGRRKHHSQKTRRRKRRDQSRTNLERAAAAPKTSKRKLKRIRHPPPLQGSSALPLSLAVYRPASLFAMLLVAALTKNAFSLRWLALSSFGGCQRNWRGGASLSARDLGRVNCMPIWDGIVVRPTSTRIEEDHSLGLEDDTFNELLQSIPRGGGQSPNDSNFGPQYSGLINLGNTCYLNAQLQCAYHVPLLRELVLAARDEIVDVEVEVDDEELADETQQGESIDEDMLNNQDDIELIESKEPTTSSVDETTAETKKKTIIKQEVHPISPALRALQQTFNSLNPNSGRSGTTQVLCRSLGINPYIQQDGQEFWKLFVPEVNYEQLAELYTGYYDDYIREIRDEKDACYEEEKKEEEDDMMQVKAQPRERVRTDPFLDLSIPVTEGSGCSVEASLKETFVQPEILRVSEGNGWRPSKNAEKVDAYKGLSLKREGLPSLLQLHLKRFKYDWETGDTSKINDRCTFPLELDMSEIITGDDTGSVDDAIYDLQSVVVHRGEYGSGHYYSYVRPDIKVNKWYRFDDQVVTPVDYSEVIADAYGGRARRRRAKSFDGGHPAKKRSVLRRLFSFGSFGGDNGGAFGYGGRSSSAYMIQYVRRSDIAKLHY